MRRVIVHETPEARKSAGMLLAYQVSPGARLAIDKAAAEQAKQVEDERRAAGDGPDQVPAV